MALTNQQPPRKPQTATAIQEAFQLIFDDTYAAVVSLKDTQTNPWEDLIILQMVLLVNVIEEYQPWVLGGRKSLKEVFDKR